jgi:hypothetical protein
MKSLHRYLFAAALLFAGIAHADGPADWKVYGFTSTKPQAVMFYLNSEIVRTPEHVQVWTKSLDTKKLEGFFNDVKSPAFDKTVTLWRNGYTPPLGTVFPLSKERAAMITSYEQLADLATITPSLRILYEIDCSQKLTRVLSVITPAESLDMVRHWEHIPPESTIETLSKLTCTPS